MRITVRLFARLRELVGTGELERQVPDTATVGSIWQELANEFPIIAPYGESMSCAVNAEYARMTSRVKEGDEVAFLPPVSGG